MENIYLKTKKLLTIAVFLIATHVSVAQNTWYINDSYTAGVDIYTTAVGNNSTNAANDPSKPSATLADAITAAATGDTIYIDAGTFSDVALTINKGVTLIGAGNGNTIFDVNGANNRFANFSVSNVVIKNIQLREFALNGSGAGVIAITGAITGVVFENVLLSSNRGTANGEQNVVISGGANVTITNSFFKCSGFGGSFGGAIFVNASTLNISNSVFYQAEGLSEDGSAIGLNASSTVIVTNCTFTDNHAKKGGAIGMTGGSLTVTGSCFDGNNIIGSAPASSDGGGAFYISGGTASFTNCSFTNNCIGSSGDCATSTTPRGGAIYIVGGTTTLNTCQFENNIGGAASGRGADIHLRTAGTANITNCFFRTIHTSTLVNVGNESGTAVNWASSGTPTANGSGVALTNPETSGTITAPSPSNPSGTVATSCLSSASIASCAVTVNCATETEAPLILRCVENKTITDCSGTLPNYTSELSAFDDCTFTVTQSPAPGTLLSTLSNGNHTITFTVSDQSASSPNTTCTMTLTLSGCVAGCTIKTWTAGAWSPAGTPTTANEVVIDDTYNTTTHGNIECCKLTVNAGKTLTITGDMYALLVNELINNGTFTIENNGSLVQQDNTKTNTGNVIYKRTAKARNSDYVYWSSPVASYALSGHVATGPKYIWNTTAANANLTQGAWDAAPATLGLAQGVIVRGNADFSDVTTTINDFENIFTGVPNNCIITKQISRGNLQGSGTTTGNATITAIDDNHNLIGNPYASAISAKDFLTLNSANLTGALQIWTHGTLVGNNGQSFYQNFSNSYSINDYVSYNLSGTTFSPGTDYNIGAGQGFFVALVDGATASTVDVTFNNAMRRTTGNSSTSATPNFFRNSSSQNQASKFWIDLVADNGVSSRSLVAYVEGATNQKDNLHDAITKPQGNLLLYSKLGEDRLNIQGKGLPFVDEDQVPMGYFAPAAGNYTLALAFVEGTFSNGQTIYVKDNLLNTYHNLSQNPYLFNTQAGENQNRFVIVYKTTLGNDNFITVDVSIYVNDVISIKSNETIESIQIFDVLGKEIKKYENLSTTSFQDDFNLSNGVYIVKLKTDKNNTISKKVLK